MTTVSINDATVNRSQIQHRVTLEAIEARSNGYSLDWYVKEQGSQASVLILTLDDSLPTQVRFVYPIIEDV